MSRDPNSSGADRVTKPNEEIVRDMLSKHGRDAKLRAAVEHGWKTLEGYPDKNNWRRKTTRASIVWENMIEKAIELFDGEPGVRIVPHHDTYSFIFDDTVLVRFKKAAVSLRTSNVQTELACLFHDHAADLFGFSGLQRVEVVYVVNRFETDLDWIGVVARQDDSVLWNYELAPEFAPVLVPLPAPARADTASLAKLKETAKGKKQVKKEE